LFTPSRAFFRRSFWLRVKVEVDDNAFVGLVDQRGDADDADVPADVNQPAAVDVAKPHIECGNGQLDREHVVHVDGVAVQQQFLNWVYEPGLKSDPSGFFRFRPLR
jgi:hypothetical protein